MMNVSKQKIYEMIYSYPLINPSGKEEISILITGDAEASLVLFKAVYHLGQAVYIKDDGRISFRRMKITISTAEGEAFYERIRDEMPGIGIYPEYADVTCCLEEEGKALDADFRIHALNGEVSLTLPDGRTAAAPDSEAADRLDKINLNQKYVNMLSRDACALFSETKQLRDMQKTKDRYSFISSYACSAHMPMKLYLFSKEECGEEEALAELLSKPASEREKDIRYKALLVLEHRRWNAFMISDGYRAPFPAEFYKNAYRTWTDHKDKAARLHPCICDMGQDPFYLKNHPECWAKEDFEKDEQLSELDKLSIRNYRLCCEIAAGKQDSLLHQLTEIERRAPELERFITVVRNIILDERYEADYLYRVGRAEAEALHDGHYKDEVDRIDKGLSIFRARNKRKNFALLDENIINALSFNLWHGIKYKTTIVAMSGNAARDVSLPFMLSCDSTYYLMDKSREELVDEKSKIIRFFKSRQLSNPEFIEVDLSSVDEIRSTVKGISRKDGTENESIALDCSDNPYGRSQYIFIRMSVELYRYAPLSIKETDIIDCRTGREINCGISRSITTAEYLDLAAAEYQNLYGEGHPSFPEYEDIRYIFEKYSDNIGGTENSAVNIWSLMHGTFTQSSKNINMQQFFGEDIMKRIAAMGAESENGHVEKLTFDPKVYEELRVEKLLGTLSRNRIIGHVTGNPLEEGITVDAPDKSIRDVITGLSLMEPRDIIVQKEIEPHSEMSPKNSFIYRDQKGLPTTIFSKSDSDEIRAYKAAFMTEMRDLGLISFTKGSPESDEATFDFPNIYVKRLFQFMGKIFELILFRKIQDLKLFSDVQNGVEISWQSGAMGDIPGRMEQYFSENEGLGKKYFQDAKKWSRDMVGNSVQNEIDIVMMKDMKPSFISCKTGTELKREWIYEIAAVAAHFDATPALAVAFDLDKVAENNKIFLLRAKAMGISVFGRETFLDNERLRECMRLVARGEVYSVL